MAKHEHDFTSSWILCGEYDDVTEEMDLYFIKQGGPYKHKGVPKQVWEAFTKASSPGEYYNYHIRGIY